MGRDHWVVLGWLGAALASLTPVAVLVLGSIGFGAWAGRLDIAPLPLLARFVVPAASRCFRRGRAR